MEKDYEVCIIGGCGHVGLPLGLAFADCGKKVILYDIDRKNVDSVNRKVMPFLEEGAPQVLSRTVEKGLLKATMDQSVIASSRNIIVVIGTPVDEHLNPKLHQVLGVFKEMVRYLDRDQLVVLRSTIYPGMTGKIHGFLSEQIGEIGVAFCPERVAEGFGLKEIGQLPQIISAYDPATLGRAKDLFSVLEVDMVELTPEEAELAKLFTNAWRYINFATANQFFMLAENYGLDFYRIYQAMTHHYPRLQGFAKAGFAAGPCLFKDTMQLSAFSGNHFFLGHAAMLVNEGLPTFIVEQLKKKTDLKGKNVGILGMAFKANHDDPRDSLAYKLKKILEMETDRVFCSDVYIRDPDFLEMEELIRRSEIIILASPHREYGSLDLKGKLVVDIWNFWGRGLQP